MSLYFESHVTIEPVFDERLEQLKAICRKYSFHVADLLMKKRKEDTPERSAFDTFCTGRSADGVELQLRMRKLILNLKAENFAVWRYKIEDCTLDSKISDGLGLLNYESTND